MSMTDTVTILKAAGADWIEHDGKGMPIDGETKVVLLFRDGDMRVGRAAHWDDGGDEYSNWVHRADDPDFDIVSYRIITPSKAITAAEEAGR
jgi:hypothetical protein